MWKCRVRTVIRYTHRALTTIHRMGKRPNAAPCASLEAVWPSGMRREPGGESGRQEACEACQVRLHADAAEQDADDHQGQGRDEGGQPERVGDGFEFLDVHGASPIPSCGKRFLN